MLKQLAVRLEEDFIKEVKTAAVQQGVSLQEYVKLALVSYAGITPQTKPEVVVAPSKKPTPTPIIVETKGVHEALTTPSPSFISADYVPQTLEEIMNAEEDPMDERYFYILRKTFAMDLPEDEDTSVTNGTMRWTIPKNCCKHYDDQGYLIPFRYTDSFMQRVEPTPEQIKQLEEAYGKPVTIEV